jgi:NAD(P)-dependent dehydrogenase (short-subunit alcohol dehydrogenase family)
MRLKHKIAIVVGAGQSPGEGVGNSRATAMLCTREDTTVACVDMHLDRAEETAALIPALDDCLAAMRPRMRRPCHACLAGTG